MNLNPVLLIGGPRNRTVEVFEHIPDYFYVQELVSLDIVDMLRKPLDPTEPWPIKRHEYRIVHVGDMPIGIHESLKPDLHRIAKEWK